MFNWGFVGIVAIVFFAIAILRNRKHPLSRVILIISLVVFSVATFYFGMIGNNPWHKEKRALEWGQQLQDWHTDEEAEEAASALDEIGGSAFGALSLAIEHSDPKVSKKAADVIASICSRDEQFEHRHKNIFKYVLQVLEQSDDTSVRLHLAITLPNCGAVAHNEEVMQTLSTVSRNDSDDAVRQAATRSLDKLNRLPKEEAKELSAEERLAELVMPSWAVIPIGLVSGLIGAIVSVVIVDQRGEIPACIIESDSTDRHEFTKLVFTVHGLSLACGLLIGGICVMIYQKNEIMAHFWTVMWTTALPSFGFGLFGSIRLLRARLQNWS